MDVITYALCKGNGGGGSGGGVLVVNGTWDEDWTTCTLDKTWQEINDGGFGVIKIVDGDNIDYMPIVGVTHGIGLYFVGVFDGSNMVRLNFSATSASGYPIQTE